AHAGGKRARPVRRDARRQGPAGLGHLAAGLRAAAGRRLQPACERGLQSARWMAAASVRPMADRLSATTPNSVSGGAPAMCTAAYPPIATITNRTVLASSGHASLPAP